MDVLSSVLDGMRSGLPVIYQVRCHGPWGRSFAQLPGVGMHVVLSGSCWVHPEDGGEPVRLAAGDVALMPHGHAHGLSGAQDTPLEFVPPPGDDIRQCTPAAPLELGTPVPGREPDTVLLCGTYPLDQTRRHPFLAELPAVVVLPARLGVHPELRSAVELLAGELAAPQMGSGSLTAALFDAVLLYSLRAWLSDVPCVGASWATALADPAVGTALNAMHTSPGEPWTVESLGAAAGLSRAAFARRFSQLVGQSPLSYLTWWRMSLAARLLRESDQPLAQVARQAGYASEFAFAGAFKREFGMPPARFRRERGDGGALRTPAPVDVLPAPRAAGRADAPRTPAGTARTAPVQQTSSRSR